MTSVAPERVGSAPEHRVPLWARTAPLGLYGFSRIAFWISGGGFSTVLLNEAYQLLDPTWLAADPFGTAWRLHMQPPLFNLLVGLVLRWSPLPTALSFQIIYLLCGLVMVAALVDLLLGLGASALTACIGASVVALDPLLLSYQNILSYEYPVATLLVVAAWGLKRYARTRRAPAYVAFLGCGATAVMTRSLLHPLWLLAVVVFALVVCRPVSWRVVGSLTAVAFVVVGGWMVKNEVIAGSPALSSWFGMNLERSVLSPFPEGRLDQLVREHRLSGAAKVPPFSPYESYKPFVDRCRSHSSHPDLGSTVKPNGGPNLNAACFVPVYSQAQNIALHALRDQPGRYLSSRGTGSLLYVARSDAPQAPRTEVTDLLHDIANPLTLELTVTTDVGDWWITPFGTDHLSFRVSLLMAGAIIYALGLGVVAAINLIRRRGDRTRDVVLVFIAFTVVFVSLSSILFEFWEQNRLRVILDPLLLGLATMGIASGIRLIRELAARTARASRPAPTGGSGGLGQTSDSRRARGGVASERQTRAGADTPRRAGAGD
jgi:hypothetical protein